VSIRNQEAKRWAGWFIGNGVDNSTRTADRYAGRVVKKIKSIDKRSLKLLQFYFEPGNIRDLQR
jgi:hypothetical protein